MRIPRLGVGFELSVNGSVNPPSGSLIGKSGPLKHLLGRRKTTATAIESPIDHPSELFDAPRLIQQPDFAHRSAACVVLRYVIVMMSHRSDWREVCDGYRLMPVSN